ncbi:heavy metal translocating P-type ATPase [Devosia aquimaris]|uniref:heavy metal translocating P-type ATPase n=1 Tax=Devosia aquimaris TaxID=2866214 RepID=UPI001CD0B00E|nr:heavy metal translocating P-type ATPase [Devosia sp. CJK-A8-3]
MTTLTAPAGAAPVELDPFIAYAADGTGEICFAVPDAYCAACIQAIEGELTNVAGVRSARVNLSQRRVLIRYDQSADVSGFAGHITRSGYRNFPVDATVDPQHDAALTELVRALAVSGFAAGNIMLFSVSVWAGADEATRALFHWLSALLALPAIVYAGRPFFRSAWSALRVGRTNMDVPISIGVTLTTALSLFETVTGGEHAYFDASTMLLFFLLAGRTLDHMMRKQARSAVDNLARLSPRGAYQLLDDGTVAFVRLADIVPGMRFALKAGERVPVDATVVDGNGQIDMAMVNGESIPLAASPGTSLPAGAINLLGSLEIVAARPARDSFLARMQAYVEAAEDTRTRYRRIADRAAQLYAPVVHLTAAITFLGWLVMGAGWHAALLNAVAVLIITCPCALALAVPIVHVVAAGRLFANGVVMREGSALERMGAVRVAAFDKTGTLTLGTPRLVRQEPDDPALLAVAARLGAQSNHPLSRAIAAAAEAEGHLNVDPIAVTEVPGKGVSAQIGNADWKLGSAAFCNAEDKDGDSASHVWLARDGQPVAQFFFRDAPRSDASAAVAGMARLGVPVHVLSGDRGAAVADVANAVGATNWLAGLTPEQKQAAIADLRRDHGAVLMVGDGINDAPALRAADVSIAPASAADIGRAAADFILTNDKLTGVPFVVSVARRADRLVRENLGFAVAYNAVVLPLAILGYVTPLVAAIAMSSSSVIVVLNALRLRLGAGPSEFAASRR